MLNSSKSTSKSLENCYERQLDERGQHNQYMHMPWSFHDGTQIDSVSGHGIHFEYWVDTYIFIYLIMQFYLYRFESPACKKTYTVIFHTPCIIDIKISCGGISIHLFLKITLTVKVSLKSIYYLR